jgi:peroxiredoxin
MRGEVVMIEIGKSAPDFVLNDQNGKAVKLSSYKGKRVLLSFRPLAWTPVCTDQMSDLEKNFDRFKQLNAVALGVGVDSSASNKAWAMSLNIEKTRLLADFWPHGEVSRLYGLFRDKDGFSERANVIIDQNQVVVFAKLYPIQQLPDTDEIMRFLESHK